MKTMIILAALAFALFKLNQMQSQLERIERNTKPPPQMVPQIVIQATNSP